MGKKIFKRFVLALSALVVLWGQTEHTGFCQDAPAPPPGRTTLVQAVICEGIEAYAPLNPAVVFSLTLGTISCFSAFDPVLTETHIFHKWYFRDRLATRKKLTLKPPRWGTFSSIQLRQEDKGPWRVDIVDSSGRVIDVLRFSITD